MKYYVLFATFFMLPGLLKAQSNYKPGYYINTRNDTVKGFIDQRERFDNPKVFYFKSDLSQPPKDITLADAKAVVISGYNYFEKFTTSVSKGYITLSRLGNAIDSTYVIDTVFLRVIKKGKSISLYAYTDNVKTRYYVFDNFSDKITELKYFTYLSDETKSTVNINSYRLQLLSIAGEYQGSNAKLSDRINTASYDENDLLKIVQLINGGNENEKSESKNLSGSRYFIGFGLKSSTLAFTGINFVYPDGGSKSNVSPTLSGGLDFILNKETQKVIFRAEVSFTYNQYNMDNINTSVFVDQVSSSLDVTQFTSTIHPQLIYNFYSSDIFKIYLDAGFAINLSAFNNYSYVSTTTYASGTSFKNVQNKYPAFQTAWFSIPLKMGFVVTKNIELFGAYWIPASLTKYTNSNASITSYQVGLNYLIGYK
jgi:hypothetical protein